MTIATTEDPAINEPQLRRFTVTTPADDVTTPESHTIRSSYTEEHWLAFIGPNAFLVARHIDTLLTSSNKEAFDIHKVGDQLGISSLDVLAACYRLVRYGLATFSDPRRDPTLYLKRHWPPIPAAITTPTHRAALVALDDFPELP